MHTRSKHPVTCPPHTRAPHLAARVAVRLGQDVQLDRLVGAELGEVGLEQQVPPLARLLLMMMVMVCVVV